MSLKSLNTPAYKTYHIDALNKGLDLGKNGHTDSVGGMSLCKNVWLNNGILQNRPGIETSALNVLDDADYRNGFRYNFNASGIEVTVDDQILKLLIEEIDYSESRYVCLTHFINPDGTVWDTAEIAFSRASDSEFYIPKSMVFFKGKPIAGGGIFAFASLVNTEDFSQTESRIYEIDISFSSWEICTDYYVPTVYINGRGNGYEIAADSNQAYTGTPKMLEKLNILNGMFYAYFSSDSRSSSFQLPYSNLADQKVSCRFYYSLSDYVEWIIPSGAVSAKASYGEVEITMNVNRQKGIVYFTVPAGDYEIPMISYQNANNLRFTATKPVNYDINDICESTLCFSDNSKTLLASRNIIFEADCGNPLYFPADSAVSIGEDDSYITAFAGLKEKIIAFKKEEMYSLSVNVGKALNSTSLLADNDSVFFDNDTIEISRISAVCGTQHMSSVIGNDNTVFWKGTDGYIYGLQKSSQNIVCISQKINGFIDGNINLSSKTFGLKLDGRYLFITDKNALLFESPETNSISAENISWYYWEFPDCIKFTGIFHMYGRPCLICTNTQDLINFTAFLDGDSDVILSGNIFDPETAEITINSEIHTVKISMGCDNTPKKVRAVSLRTTAENAIVAINDVTVSQIQNINSGKALKTVKIHPGLSGVNDLNISVSATGGFRLGGIDLEFTELKL